MIKIMDFAQMTAEEIFARSEPTYDVSDIVSSIISDVRENGDEALVRYAAKFDGIDPQGFELELTEDEKKASTCLLFKLDENNKIYSINILDF